MKLLIVEDERELSDAMAEYLTREDYRCEQAFSREEAEEKIELYEYDCILLDLMLRGRNGLGLLGLIRKRTPQTGIIIVSAKDSTDDKVAGLRMGADDYLPKPFHLSELSMRIFALLRRKRFTSENRLRSGRLTVDLLQKAASVEGRAVDLTKTEYELLLFLIGNRRRVVSKSAVAEHLSGDMADMMDDFGFVYAHIKNLKAKLAAAGMADCIKTYYGTGYQWRAEE